MNDKNKDEVAYDGPPDHIPDGHLAPAALEKRRLAGREHVPHPTKDYDPTTGELVPRVQKVPEKKSFFGNKKED